MTTEQILEKIKKERGESALRDGQSLLGLFRDYSHNQLLPQANALRTFLECNGNQRILNLCSEPSQKQQTEYHRLIQEMVGNYGMQKKVALEISGAFWRVAIGTEYPVPSAQQEKRLEKSEEDSKSADDRIPEIEKKQEKKDPEPLPVPDPPAPKPKPDPSRWKKLVLLVLAVLLALMALSFVVGGDSGKRTRAELKPYGLEDSIEDMLLAGTEEVYTYPDGTWMEFYYNDAGQEIYRVYVNQENHIENLFEARYDDSGRLVYHQIFDGAGNLLRSDSYDFHSSEDTAQRRITLGDGRSFQGQSAFDENGYETFTLNHQDGTKTVSRFEDGGVLTYRRLLDAEGNGPDVIYFDDPVNFDMYEWESRPKVYGPRQTVIGWNGGKNYTVSYVQGICGGALKEYSVDSTSEEDQAAFIKTYDPMGNLLEKWYYRDAQMKELGSHEVHSYDQQGNYIGYMDTFYWGDGDYNIEQYDANGIRLSLETHRFEGEKETVHSSRYETEVDDQGREICVREFDGETGQPESIEEYEYDSQGNRIKRTRTAYYEDGGYSVFVEDGEGKDLSNITYYPNGNIDWQNEYSKDGVQSKRTWYYESGQVRSVTEYNKQGKQTMKTYYYESGKVETLTEYSDQGIIEKSTDYYENSKVKSVTEYNDVGSIIKFTGYDENGNVEFSWGRRYEYDANGNVIKEISLDAEGSVTGWEIFEYDADGNEEKTTQYDANGKMTGWTEYTYDENGRFVDSQYHHAS